MILQFVDRFAIERFQAAADVELPLVPSNVMPLPPGDLSTIRISAPFGNRQRSWNSVAVL